MGYYLLVMLIPCRCPHRLLSASGHGDGDCGRGSSGEHGRSLSHEVTCKRKKKFFRNQRRTGEMVQVLKAFATTW